MAIKSFGDTVLTFQFSEEIRTFLDEFAHDDASNPTWESSATDRVARVKNLEDVNYFPVASQEKQEPLELRYIAHSTDRQSATGFRSQKVGEINDRKSSQEGLNPTTRLTSKDTVIHTAYCSHAIGSDRF